MKKCFAKWRKNGHLAGITAAGCLCFHTFRVKYEKIPGGKCNEEAERLEAERKAEAERLERERKEEEHRIAVEKRKKKAKKVFIAIASVASVCAVFLILLKTVIIPKQRINKIKTANVGDIIAFGTYEQDNDTTNGKEDIEWLVLAKENNRILAISDKALDCQPYNTSLSDVTWENCTLRKWLNDDFVNVAFDAEERKMIPSVIVSAYKNPIYDTNYKNATNDRVFLLNITEVNKYFSSDSARQCRPTDYAVANGAYKSNDNVCWWWLRSPGYRQCSATIVYYGGDVNEPGYGVSNDGYAVRPAMWITIDG